MMKKGQFDKESRILKALAHKTRLAIVTELLRREKCVSDIRDLLEMRQSNISQHLAILRWAGIVDCRHEGKTRCYYLTDPGMMLKLFELFKRCKS